jgi:small-conductance mechanosensitive channel
VLADPPPTVSVAALGGSSLDFEIQASVDSFDKRSRVKDEINVGVARALREGGI